MVKCKKQPDSDGFPFNQKRKHNNKDYFFLGWEGLFLINKNGKKFAKYIS